MNGMLLMPGFMPAELLHGTVQFLLRMQRPSGEIPWFEGGKTDPWDHVEAAMGLSIGGELDAARSAYLWLQEHQLPDGSWWAGYRADAADHEPRRETHFVAYIATGVWHHYLISQDRKFLKALWPTVQRAVDFVLSQQTPFGDIHWAVDAQGKPMQDALVTGCSSIYKSLECALHIATVLGHPQPGWQQGRWALGQVLREQPQRFDRTWDSKARYAMDWFYPVLTGVVQGPAARVRLASRWDEFVESGMGCRCVVEEPWVTVAESCELVMALLGAGERQRAAELFSWLGQWRHSDGSYWTGYQFVENLLWPDERPTWTAAAVLLAADALCLHTQAAQLFTDVGTTIPARISGNCA